MLRVPSNFYLTLAGQGTVTCAEATARLLKDKRDSGQVPRTDGESGPDSRRRVCCRYPDSGAS